MEALLLLVASAGQIVERRRLMQTVWPDRIVEDNNLNQCILAIRKVLGETAGSNHFVMTVPGRGFCFVCPVRVRIQESAEGTAVQSLAVDSAATVAPAAAVIAGEQAAARAASPGLTLGRPFWLGMALGGVLVAALLLPFALG